MVHPSPDTVRVTSKLGHAKAPLPAVIPQGSHRDFRPDRVACPAIAQHSAQQVMTICKDVSLNHDLLAEGALNGKTAASMAGCIPSIITRFRPASGCIQPPLFVPSKQTSCQV